MVPDPTFRKVTESTVPLDPLNVGEMLCGELEALACVATIVTSVYGPAPVVPEEFCSNVHVPELILAHPDPINWNPPEFAPVIVNAAVEAGEAGDMVTVRVPTTPFGVFGVYVVFDRLILAIIWALPVIVSGWENGELDIPACVATTFMEYVPAGTTPFVSRLLPEIWKSDALVPVTE